MGQCSPKQHITKTEQELQRLTYPRKLAMEVADKDDEK